MSLFKTITPDMVGKKYRIARGGLVIRILTLGISPLYDGGRPLEWVHFETLESEVPEDVGDKPVMPSKMLADALIAEVDQS